MVETNVYLGTKIEEGKISMKEKKDHLVKVNDRGFSSWISKREVFTVENSPKTFTRIPMVRTGMTCVKAYEDTSVLLTDPKDELYVSGSGKK